MTTQTTLLQNPNAQTQQNPQQQNPMQQTTATQPTGAGQPPVQQTVQQTAPAPGAGTAQQVAPKPGDKALLVGNPQFAQSVQDYEQALGFDPAIHSVQGQMEGLLNSDNRFIQQARDRASLESASRGLRNSSIAVQAGEEAAIAAALPIAQADAELQMQSRLAAFGAAVDDQMLQKQHGFDLEKIAVEFENNKALAEQAFGFNKQLAHIEGGYQMQAARLSASTQKEVASMQIAASANELASQQAFQAQQAQQQNEWQAAQTEKQNEWQAAQNQLDQDFKGAQAGLDREQQTMLATTEMSWKSTENQLDRELKELLASEELAANSKGALSGHFTNLMMSADSAISNVLMSDLKPADKSREIARIQSQAQANWRALQDYYKGSTEVLGNMTW